MGYNKTKVLEAAQKCLNQGKTPQAISQYQEILRHEPNDQVTLMTIGDLFVRNNNIDDATDYFERLAKIYLSNGFLSKAIAIYKKIAKLQPDQTRPLERLAELYVQQGVLSEARPIYLQLAEGYWKQKDSEKAVTILHKLLEAEPDNVRVQHRLAELYTAMGQPKESATVYQVSARRLADRGDWQEALDMAERVLKTDEKSTPALTIQARALASLGKKLEAVAVLETLPAPKEISESTELLLDLYLAGGQFDHAVELSQKIFEANIKNYSFLFKTATAMIEDGDASRALELLDQIRILMIESADADRIGQALTSASERMPTRLEPLEWLVDLYGRTNDSFRLPDAQTKLGNAALNAGRLEQALEAFEQALERNPEDEQIQTRLAQVRARLGLGPVDRESVPAPPVSPEDTTTQDARPTPPEPDMDEETRRYVTQALTDVDLFSSYGLSQKAIELLEQVVGKVSRHTQALEKLLDLYLGAGDDRRTSDLAATLEEIYQKAGDTVNAERFAELRRRYQRAADRAPAEPAPVRPAAPPAEFEMPVEQNTFSPVVTDATPEAVALSTEVVAAESQDEEVAALSSAQKASEPAAADGDELDLSDEWAALSEQLTEAPANLESERVPEETADISGAAAPSDSSASVTEEIVEELVLSGPPAEEAASESQSEPVAEEAPVDFDLVLTKGEQSSGPATRAPMSADEFVEDLVADLETLALTPPAEELTPATPVALDAGMLGPAPANGQDPVAVAAGPRDHLSEVFDEFRAELGEMNEDTEDLETHYNLGIAYREMGLLEEAIGEFQKVAKAVQSGHPFRYAMQCCTLLGLIFMDKNQPGISALWYERALQTPGLDQESILALRYDLGMAQEAAGDIRAARDNFSRVYAINIDYRDVAERIAGLQNKA